MTMQIIPGLHKCPVIVCIRAVRQNHLSVFKFVFPADKESIYLQGSTEKEGGDSEV